MSYGKWHRTPSSRTVCAILDRSSRMSRVIGALYRLLYDGVLCRLPEPTAVALGQTALRLLPWDRLAVFRLDDPRLADRKSTRLNSSHSSISYAVFCLKKKT